MIVDVSQLICISCKSKRSQFCDHRKLKKSYNYCNFLSFHLTVHNISELSKHDNLKPAISQKMKVFEQALIRTIDCWLNDSLVDQLSQRY